MMTVSMGVFGLEIIVDARSDDGNTESRQHYSGEQSPHQHGSVCHVRHTSVKPPNLVTNPGILEHDCVQSQVMLQLQLTFRPRLLSIL